MAKDRIHSLEQTSATFQVRGIVTGMRKEKAYQSGKTKNGGEWNSLDFGLMINNNKTVFLKLRGFPRSEVFYYKSGEKGAKGTTVRVPWKNRKKSPGEGYRLIGVNISTSKDENGKNVNEMFTEYDAVEYLAKALKDGESLFIKGNMVFTSFTDRNDQTKRSVELNPTQISYTQPIDFSADDFKEMAEFENTLVYSGIEKETDEDDKHTGRFILSGYSIGYSTVEPVNFVVDADHAKLAANLKKKLKSSHAIKTYGRIEITNNVAVVEDDDGWGESSPMERQNAPVKREYVIYKALPDSIDTETYSDGEIAKAIKAIKQAKTASEKFAETSDDDDDEDVDWGDADEAPFDTDDEWAD